MSQAWLWFFLGQASASDPWQKETRPSQTPQTNPTNIGIDGTPEEQIVLKVKLFQVVKAF